MLSIEARIEKHAQHTPNKLAVVSAHGATTYQQLLQQATTQAQQYQGMQQQGVVLTTVHLPRGFGRRIVYHRHHRHT